MQEYNFFVDGIAEQRARIFSSINEHGFYLHQDNKCVYTVGMTCVGFPELLMYNQSLESADEIFSDIYCGVKHDKMASIKEFIENNPFSRLVSFEPLSDTTKQSLLWSARLFLESWNFDVVELKTN